MDLVKYLVAAVVSFVAGILVWIMGNFLSGILLFVLIFGGYILWNQLKGIDKTPIKQEENTQPQEKTATTPQDN